MLYRSTQESLHDTIVAQSTGQSPAAIAIVRLCGPKACDIVKQLSGRAVLPAPYKLSRTRLRDASGHALDDALMVHMPALQSYTGEDMVELHVHGAPAVVRDVLAACRNAGARSAEGGEFTLRALLHGRLDLSQAEAVGDLVTARSTVQRQNALRLLDGGLSKQLHPLIEQLEPIIAAWRAVLDFPDYPTGDAPKASQLEVLGGILKIVERFIGGAKTDLHRPYQVALCGAPNTGKSTLLNVWAEDERALVDAQPGTTRDPIAVDMQSTGVHWVVWDTAGMRPEAVGIEARGVAMAQNRGAAVDRVLWLMLPGAPVWPMPGWQHVTVVGSRADLVDPTSRQAFAASVAAHALPFWGWVSAHTGEGVDALRTWAGSPVAPANDDDDSLFIVKARHVELLSTARDALRTCLHGHSGLTTLDVALGELELAARCLGAILGHDVDAAVLERVFKDFCIGK